MGQRPRSQQPFHPGEKDYKYKGIKDENLRPHEQCEVEQDAHVAKPQTWPPQRIGNQVGEPYIDCRCEDCGAHLQVYAAHATGAMRGIKVILPQVPVEPTEAPVMRGPKIGRPRAAQVA